MIPHVARIPTNVGRVVALIAVLPLVGAVFCVALNPLKLPNLVILLIATFAIFLLGIHFFWNPQNGSVVRKAAPESTVPEDVSIDDLLRAEGFIGRNYSLASVDYFRRILTDPPSYLSRVNERMELDGPLGMVHTTLFIRQPNTSARIQAKQAMTQEPNSDRANTPASVLFPLVSIRKGYLFDRFEAYDQSGHVLPTLSQWEIRGLLVVTLRTLFTMEILARTKKPAIRELNRKEKDVLLQVAKAIACTTLSQTDIDNALTLVDRLSDDRFGEAWKERIKRFCCSLARDHLIVVEVPMAEHSNIVLSYRNIITACEVRKFGRRNRAKHGMSPIVAEASMAWALLPDSYHFELQAPPGLYIFDHHLEELESNTVLKQVQSGGVQQYVRTYCEKGGSLAHLYIRRVGYNRDSDASPPDQKSPHQQATSGDLAKASDFKSVILFKEVPPGTLGNAATIALFAAIVIFYNTFIYDAQPSSLLTINRSVSGLLLAFPAFLAVALGRGITFDNIRRTSLTAFYGLWMIVLTSVTALLLFAFGVDRFESLQLSIHVFGFVHRNVNIAWMCLAFISIAIYLALRKEKSDQRKYYLSILKKSAVVSRGR